MSWYAEKKPYGNQAVLLTGLNPNIIESIENLPCEGFTVRGGIDSLLVSATSAKPLPEIMAFLESQVSSASATVSSHRNVHNIPVRWNGTDMEAVSGMLNLSVDRVIADIESSSFDVLLIGFAPGFPYLKPSEGSPVSQWATIPRLAVPRRSVPAGAIGVAADMACIYPTSLPGGWNILGQTEAVLFDATAETPSLMSRGDTVRFVSVGEVAL